MTTKLLFIRRADLIIRQHMNKGLEYLDKDTICAYTREIDRFVAYAFSGIQTLLPSPLRGARQGLSPEFEGIVAEFLSGNSHPNTRCDMHWTATKYFAWLETRALKIWRVPALSRYRSSFWIVRRNMLRALSMTSSCILKKLYAFLHASGRSEEDFRELLSFKVNRDKKVYPPLPKSDIAKLLDTIDRTSITGKRDYAVKDIESR